MDEIPGLFVLHYFRALVFENSNDGLNICYIFRRPPGSRMFKHFSDTIKLCDLIWIAQAI